VTPGAAQVAGGLVGTSNSVGTRMVRPRSGASLGRGGIWPALALLAIGLAGVAPIALSGIRRDADTLSRPAVTVEVIADGLRFMPAEFHVPAGASVRVDFSNTDPSGPHVFETLGQYRDTRQVLWPGDKRTTVFIATDRPGRYPFVCSVRGHTEAGMTGVIVVEPVDGQS
jgi:plastocyanin